MPSLNNIVLLFVALFLSCWVTATLAFDLLLLHNNDMHGRFEETSPTSGTCKPAENGQRRCYGGFARTAHVVREARRKAKSGLGPPVLFLNAGDTYTGTAWFSVHKWRIAVDFINRLQPDAISFGNHEFDYGIEGVLPFLENLKVPLVAANMDFSNVTQMTVPIKKSTVLAVDGVKVGVIGYLLPDTQVIANTGEIIFLDEVESIRKESERLDAEGVQIIIALGHSGFEMDKKIAAHCPLVDVVVGGHTNTFLWNGMAPDLEAPEGKYPTMVKQKSGKIVPVVQAYAYTKYLGALNLTFDDDGNLLSAHGQPILLDSTIPQDDDILENLETYRSALEERLKQNLGISKVVLSLTGCRLHECNFGNLVSDAIVEFHALQYHGAYWTDAPCAILNGGSIRSSVDAGGITYGDILGALPFDLSIIAFNLNGSDVIKMLENGVRGNGETSRGEFLQLSGIHVEYDLTRPVGKRVLSVKMRCGQCSTPHYEPLDENKVYRILGNSFVLSGGDAFTILKNNAYARTKEDMNDVDLVAWYVKRKQVLMPEQGERIVIVKAPQQDDDNTSSAFRINGSIYLLIALLLPTLI